MAIGRVHSTIAGAVAIRAAIRKPAILNLGFRIALAPVLIGRLTLALVTMILNRLTGWSYPFRQHEPPAKPGTPAPVPAHRLALSDEELSAILKKYRQSFNLSVEDLHAR
ncbi:HPP family protein [Hyphomonas oceanitis]|uniref:HPP family protein n=1 Tax=Hyphomonas oceanitis TaxID=81033 RepID=UPI00138E3ABB|nr:HPP family protein [Hyphomonas oceanitis]